MKYILFIIAGIFFTVNSLHANYNFICSNYNFEIKVVFEQAQPNKVLIRHGGNGGWDANEMDKLTPKEFYLSGSAEKNTFEISIEFRDGSIDGSDWINTSKGINGASVYLNNMLLDESYLIDDKLGGCNFSVKLNSDGTVEFGGGERKFGNIKKDDVK